MKAHEKLDVRVFLIELTPMKQIVTLRGNKNIYLNINPHIHNIVNFNDINSYPPCVRVNRFQFFNSSASKRKVT